MTVELLFLLELFKIAAAVVLAVLAAAALFLLALLLLGGLIRHLWKRWGK